MLAKRLSAIAAEISTLEEQMNTMVSQSSTADDDDDIFCNYNDDNSPWSGHLKSLLSRLDEFRQDRENCESLLRHSGVSVPMRDDD